MSEEQEPSQDEGRSLISIRNLVLFVFIGMIIYLIIFFYGQIDEVISAIGSIPWWWALPAMMVLSFANYGIRYLKWHYYLRRIDMDLAHADSFSIFLAGFTLTVSPGKVGEAIKGYFCNELDGTPVAKTAPVVISERVTDLLAMVLLAALAFVIGFGGENQLLLLGLVGAGLVVAAFVLGNRTFYQKVLHRLTSIGPLKRFQDSCDLIEDTMTRTLSPQPLVLSTLISLPGWFMECLELWLLLSLITGAGLPSLAPASLALLAQATFIHATASSVGAVMIFLPGGLGAYEGVAISIMEVLLGIPRSLAVASTTIIRFVTLWFSVAVGFVALAVVKHRKRARAVVMHQA
ncbi:flippase-like domain-containing protein [Candidatus Thorarchaeota archaeon]|nr:MAG: flippase-like domain-containing protein [Candidatus Thorarchaeota archaeon]